MDSNSTNVSRDLYALIKDRKANPVDGSYTNYLFDKGIEKIGKIITVEDHNILNGLGSAVCEVVAEEGKGIVRRIGVQDQFGQSAPYERLLAMNGITVEGIVEAAEKLQ
jgi:transketolase